MNSVQRQEYEERLRKLRHHRQIAIWLVLALVAIFGFRETSYEAILTLGLLLAFAGSSLVRELERQASTWPDKATEVVASHEVFTPEFGQGHVRLVPRGTSEGQDPA